MIKGIPHSRHAPPKASAMLEALRGLGYTTAAAIADIIDNSITAHAKKVNLLFVWKGESSVICIFDNGEGMTAEELDSAMRLGERSPVEARASHDLGRFGLGLKTASFSQCRRLTVASRRNATTNCLCWDLDVLGKCSDDGWYLLEEASAGTHEFIRELDTHEHGTVVIWELLDRIITSGFSQQDFLNLMDKVERHLGMVFHRYLEGQRSRMRIFINDRPITAWDPFLLDNTATWSSPIVQFYLNKEIIEAQCHVLPHKDRMNDHQYDNAGGPEGWTSQQGFYVYRNQRLLIAGSWLGLGRGRAWIKDEVHRLARIRLDIPNSIDAEWKIDIRKSTARPPVVLRSRLVRLAEDARQRARRVFAHRGQTVHRGTQAEAMQAWLTEYHNGKIRYRIDESHIAVKTVLDEAGSLGPQIRAMLKVIEETVPIQRIWLDTADAKELPRTAFAAGDAPSEVLEVLKTVYKNMVLKKGFSSCLAKEQLLNTEPFHNYPDLVQGLPDNPDYED